jgi:hypothetical protein
MAKKTKLISYEDLKTKHQWGDEESIRAVLGRMLDTDHLLLYRNQMFDSSNFGSQHLVLAGPGRTISDPEDPPSWIDPNNCGGLPSRREQLVGELDIADLRARLGKVNGVGSIVEEEG